MALMHSWIEDSLRFILITGISMTILYVVLSIIGGFITVGLTINAFFLRGIFRDLGEVKIKLATMYERFDSRDLRIEKLEENEKEIMDRINILEREILK